MQHENSNTGKKKKWLRWIKISLLVYCTIGIAAYYLQEKFFFHPVSFSADHQYKFTQPFKEVNIPVDDKTSYNLIQFTSSATPKGVVLYFHGNQDNVTHYSSNASSFTKNGFEVWMIDYPGFGKSTGTLNEEALYQQALEVYKVARARFTPKDIIIYGRSMGTGIASELASVRDCRRLILECPYYSFTSLADRFLWMYPTSQMIKYKIPTYQFLKKVTAPVTIFHGTEDGVIPFSNAKKLLPLLKQKDEFVTIEGGSHNDLASYAQLRSRLDSLLTTPSQNPQLTLNAAK